jgi:hypothetical protein
MLLVWFVTILIVNDKKPIVKKKPKVDKTDSLIIAFDSATKMQERLQSEQLKKKEELLSLEKKQKELFHKQKEQERLEKEQARLEKEKEKEERDKERLEKEKERKMKQDFEEKFEKECAKNRKLEEYLKKTHKVGDTLNEFKY